MQTRKTIGHLPKDVLCYIGAMRAREPFFRVVTDEGTRNNRALITLGVYDTLSGALRALKELSQRYNYPCVEEFALNSQVRQYGHPYNGPIYSIRGSHLYKWDGIREVEMELPADSDKAT